MGKSADLYNNVTTLNAFHPQALSGTTDITGAVIDTHGYESVTFVLVTDAIAATSLDAQLAILEDSVSSFDSPATAVADGDLLGTEAATAIDEDDDKVTKRIGYTGSKRYLRCDLAVTANNGTDSVAAFCVLGSPIQAPVAAT